ncbi:hypothetical protein B0O99DRAFT_346862 [Bisporella sp. PMI_857]|nr:hypothetical protein B0O99DRAFT_346862 [Bisporella sp. PMI_857]
MTAAISFYSTSGRIYYTPRLNTVAEQSQAPRLPDPPCRPRQRRPHSIHITRSPPGYVPLELRPQLPTKEPKNTPRYPIDLRKLASRETAKKVLGSVLSSLSSSSAAASSSTASATPTDPTMPRRLSTIVPAPPPEAASQGRPALLGVSSLDTTEMGRTSLDARGSVARQTRERALSTGSTSGAVEIEKPICSGGGVSCYITLQEPTTFLTGLDHDGTARTAHGHAPAMVRGKLILKVTRNIKLKSINLSFTGKGRTEWPEGIPPAKIETFQEDSFGNHRLPFFNAAFAGEENLPYGISCNYTLKPGSANSSVTNLNNLSSANGSNNSSSPAQSLLSLPILSNRSTRSSTLSSVSAKETKRLSLQSVQARSFQKGDSPYGPTPAQKGYQTFPPGTFEYNFEFNIDNSSPETTELPNASVRWMLECLIERSGTFKSNLIGSKEVLVIRSPSEDSLELVEPISISRRWEDQLHYEIVISGKSFPSGSKIPIAFKLMPLDKVQIHKLKVYVSENVDYHTSDRRVIRRDAKGAQRKILLIEKVAGKPLAKEYSMCDIKFNAGGEPSPEERERGRWEAERVRHRNNITGPLPEPTDNLLGDIDLPVERLIGPTEIEMQVQLPTCKMMKKDETKRLHHDCTWKNVDVHHWIKIVMRISRRDPENPDGKRRHFEISIDSPFTILDCRATRENLELPEYSGPNQTALAQQHNCGCPDATVSNTTPHTSSDIVPTLNNLRDGQRSVDVVETPHLALPPQAHLSTSSAAGVQRTHEVPQQIGSERPIHLLRHPSYNPPAFEDVEPPPPLLEPLKTPPPLYDDIIGTPSVNGLADYFHRRGLAFDDEDEEEDTDDEGRNRVMYRGRVNVPTPGGRINRSMDIDRNFMFNAQALARLNGGTHQAA